MGARARSILTLPSASIDPYRHSRLPILALHRQIVRQQVIIEDPLEALDTRP